MMSKSRQGDGQHQERTTVQEFERAMQGNKNQDKYVLRLFVTGTSPNSQRAIENVRRICEEHLQGRYELEVIDIYQQPEFAREGQIVAAPTLVKSLPPPLRKFIGDMSKTEKILIGLDLRPKHTSDDEHG